MIPDEGVSKGQNRRSHVLCLHSAALTLLTDMLGLSINPGPGLDEDDQPPPPKITSEGVVTFDITDKFVDAAKSECPGCSMA